MCQLYPSDPVPLSGVHQSSSENLASITTLHFKLWLRPSIIVAWRVRIYITDPLSTTIYLQALEDLLSMSNTPFRQRGLEHAGEPVDRICRFYEHIPAPVATTCATCCIA
jgi:hypothetical protein